MTLLLLPASLLRNCANTKTVLRLIETLRTRWTQQKKKDVLKEERKDVPKEERKEERKAVLKEEKKDAPKEEKKDAPKA